MGIVCINIPYMDPMGLGVRKDGQWPQTQDFHNENGRERALDEEVKGNSPKISL